MLVFNLTPQHYFVNIFTKNSSKNKIKVCFMMRIKRAVESNIKPFLYLIRKPRNNQKQSGNSIVGHPVSLKYSTIVHSAPPPYWLRELYSKEQYKGNL